MNPGAIEEGGKVATGVVDALKGEPISLALIVMNVIFVGVLGFSAYMLNARTTLRYEAQDAMIHKLLDQCFGKKTFFRAPALEEPVWSDHHEDRHQ